MKKPIIINLFGGPGSGKSTTAAGVFYQLKLAGYDCELVTEFAKHLTWKKDFNTLRNQIYVFAKQHDRMFHLKHQVDVIITDSPLIMGIAYCNWDLVPQSFGELIVDEFNRLDQANLNVFINRVTPYQSNGRNETLEEAIEKDHVILDILERYEVAHVKVDGDESAVEKIVNLVKKFK